MEEDEINSVAQLLGDLVTYRATGTGHLEFLAGSLLFELIMNAILFSIIVRASVDDKVSFCFYK